MERRCLAGTANVMRVCQQQAAGQPDGHYVEAVGVKWLALLGLIHQLVE